MGGKGSVGATLDAAGLLEVRCATCSGALGLSGQHSPSASRPEAWHPPPGEARYLSTSSSDTPLLDSRLLSRVFSSATTLAARCMSSVAWTSRASYSRTLRWRSSTNSRWRARERRWLSRIRAREFGAAGCRCQTRTEIVTRGGIILTSSASIGRVSRPGSQFANRHVPSSQVESSSSYHASFGGRMCVFLTNLSR